MKIDREALLPALIGLLPAGIAFATGYWEVGLALLLLPVGLVLFFRDPQRSPDSSPLADDVVVAPADGKVMHAGPVQDGVGPEGTEGWQQVSIFLSVFDVHINRTPYGGKVREVTYRPGKWLAAYKFESATENERSEITVDGARGTVIFRQIVGLVARRVVTRVQGGDVIASGQRIGLMKFGSRMDVFVPPQVRLSIQQGQRTVAGETELGRWV